MPIPEIIDGIDAYLSILHQAREILLTGRTETHQKSTRRNKRKSILERTRPARLNRRVEEKNSQSNRPIPPLSAVTDRAAARIQTNSDVTRDAPRPEQQTPVSPERAIPQGVEIKRIPARHRSGAIRSLRQQTVKPALGRKPDAIKPAIALGGSAKSKIIVVSAEQLQRQREQAAQSAVRGSRLPASGLTGRLAFEVLFNGGKEPGKTS